MHEWIYASSCDFSIHMANAINAVNNHTYSIFFHDWMPLLECFSWENTGKELEYQILCPSGYCLEHGRVVGSQVRGTPQSPCFAGARTIPQRGLRWGSREEGLVVNRMEKPPFWVWKWPPSHPVDWPELTCLGVWPAVSFASRAILLPPITYMKEKEREKTIVRKRHLKNHLIPERCSGDGLCYNVSAFYTADPHT